LELGRWVLEKFRAGPKIMEFSTNTNDKAKDLFVAFGVRLLFSGGSHSFIESEPRRTHQWRLEIAYIPLHPGVPNNLENPDPHPPP